MTRKSLVAIALLSATQTVLAEYDQWYFTTPSANNRCKNMAFGCTPPQICTHDKLTDATYCCDTGASDAVCWTDSKACNGPDKTPANGQLGCANNGFCCRSGKEQCTQREGQINICWALAVNPVANLSLVTVNGTYSSLSSSSASARTLTVSLDQLLASTSSATTTPTNSPSTTASSSSQTASSSSTSGSSLTPTSIPSTPTPSSSSSSLTGGAIAGIVVGSIAGLALLALAAFFLLRRQENKSSPEKNATELDSTSNASNPYASNPYVTQNYNPPGQHEMGATPEKYGYHIGPSEVHADDTRGPAEMPAGYGGAAELDGSAPKRAS